MIVNKKIMTEIEKASGLSVIQMVDTVGRKLAIELSDHIQKEDQILILAGKGNNGADALAMAKMMPDYHIRICLVDGLPQTEAALYYYQQIDPSLLIDLNDIDQYLNKADVIIDAVYGFSYHGNLKPEIRSIFQLINQCNGKVFSIDINSGCETMGYCDKDAIRSDLTIALDCYKPFHMLRKNHHMFKTSVLLDLDLPHDVPTEYLQIDEEYFFQHFPALKEDDYKNSNGKTMLIGGSYGVAGALMLNILGCQSIGAQYLQVVLDKSIFPIVSKKFLTPVYYPVNESDYLDVPFDRQLRCIAIGSGINRLSYKNDLLKHVLDQNIRTVVDAEGIRLLKQISHYNQHLIITPHIGEFSYLTDIPIDQIKDRLIEYASDYAQKNNSIVVLKSPNTVVASDDGRVYINQSGNASLARAGSGDVLTGMIAAMNCLIDDPFIATCMAVYFHGYIADYHILHHSKKIFDLASYPKLADKIFKKHNL